MANPSIKQPIREILRFDTSLGWRDPIITYLKDGTLPNDKAEARKLQQLASMYTLLGDTLYKKSYSNLHPDSYLRCLGPDEAQRVMQEIHDGDCENHAGGYSLIHKVINQGYYWHKMFNNTMDFVKRCPQCQIFGLVSNRPSTNLYILRSPWPFKQWGLDVVGLLSRAKPQL